MATSYPYRIQRSARKTVSLRICPDGTLLILAPYRYPIREIEQMIAKHSIWIETHRELVKKREQREQSYAGTPEQIEALRRAAREVIPLKVSYFAKLMNVTPTGVKITSAAKRFGSCNGRNSLCFSYRVMMYPEEAIDYVVVHELAHIRHHDHSPAFYAFVKSILPDYKRREAMLKEQI